MGEESLSPFKGLMIGVSGVRGVVGEGLTPEVAVLWAIGIATMTDGGKIVVARDTRPTGTMILYAVKSGLLYAGCDVDDAGVLPTPAAALAIPTRGARAGIIITASHNPQSWNALKFVRADGRMFKPSEFETLHKIVVNGPLRSVPWNRMGREVFWDKGEEVYIGQLLGLGWLDLDRIIRRKLKVAFDGVNGAGVEVYPNLLEALGCEVVRINCRNDGIFPRGPEPTPENLTELSRVVKEERCDLGFAVDPDGDRLSVVDEMGSPIGEEATLALAVMEVLFHRPGPLVINTLTSQMVADVAERAGLPCYRSKVGEAFVAEMMERQKAVVGGEGNGGIIYPEFHLVRDAGLGMVIILNLIARSKSTISRLAAQLPRYHMRKATYPISDIDHTALFERIAKLYPNDQITQLDGIRVTTPHGWVQVRLSNTEPILRVFAESDDPEQGDRMMQEMLGHIRALSQDL